MLSALLQSHVEEIFKEAAIRAFPVFGVNQAAFDSYWRQVKNWGNPSDANIKNLFLRLGVPDVFDGFSWQKATTDYIKRRLDELNQIRNKIAHGSRELSIDNATYSLTLKKVAGFRNFAEAFGARFTEHVEGLIP